MEKLLDHLIKGRVEDTLSECICYLIEKESDGGASFVEKVFGIKNAVLVVIDTQLRLTTDKGQKIVPDLVISIEDDTGKHHQIVIESKYDDRLTDSKEKYFEYFRQFMNCRMFLLCHENDVESFQETAIRLKMDFASVITFKMITDALKPTDPVDVKILEFVKGYAYRNYVDEKAKQVLLLQSFGLQNTDLNLPFDPRMKQILKRIWDLEVRKKALWNIEYTEKPLEVLLNLGDSGEFFSIYNSIYHDNGLLRFYPSKNPRNELEVVGIRKNKIFYKTQNEIKFTANHKKTLKFYFELFTFLKGYKPKYFANTTKKINEQDEVLSLGIMRSFKYLELVFSSEIYLRFAWVKHGFSVIRTEDWNEFCSTIEYTEENSISNRYLSVARDGSYREVYEGKGIRINRILDVERFYRSLLKIF